MTNVTETCTDGVAADVDEALPPHLRNRTSCASTSSNLTGTAGHTLNGDACDGVLPSTTSELSSSMILSTLSYWGNSNSLSVTGPMTSLARMRTSSLADSQQPRPPATHASTRRGSVDCLSNAIFPMECPKEEEEEETGPENAAPGDAKAAAMTAGCSSATAAGTAAATSDRDGARCLGPQDFTQCRTFGSSRQPALLPCDGVPLGVLVPVPSEEDEEEAPDLEEGAEEEEAEEEDEAGDGSSGERAAVCFTESMLALDAADLIANEAEALAVLAGDLGEVVPADLPAVLSPRGGAVHGMSPGLGELLAAAGGRGPVIRGAMRDPRVSTSVGFDLRSGTDRQVTGSCGQLAAAASLKHLRNQTALALGDDSAIARARAGAVESTAAGNKRAGGADPRGGCASAAAAVSFLRRLGGAIAGSGASVESSSGTVRLPCLAGSTNRLQMSSECERWQQQQQPGLGGGIGGIGTGTTSSSDRGHPIAHGPPARGTHPHHLLHNHHRQIPSTDLPTGPLLPASLLLPAGPLALAAGSFGGDRASAANATGHDVGAAVLEYDDEFADLVREMLGSGTAVTGDWLGSGDAESRDGAASGAAATLPPPAAGIPELAERRTQQYMPYMQGLQPWYCRPVSPGLSWSPLAERTYSIRFAPPWTPNASSDTRATHRLPSQLPMPPLTAPDSGSAQDGGISSNKGEANKDDGSPGTGAGTGSSAAGAESCGSAIPAGLRDFAAAACRRITAATASAAALGLPTSSGRRVGSRRVARCRGPSAVRGMCGSSESANFRAQHAEALRAAAEAAAVAGPSEAHFYRPCVTGYQKRSPSGAMAAFIRANGGSGAAGVIRTDARAGRTGLLASTGSLAGYLGGLRRGSDRYASGGGVGGVDGGAGPGSGRRPHAATAGENGMYDVQRGFVGVRHRGMVRAGGRGGSGGVGAGREGDAEDDDDSIMVHRALDLDTLEIEYGSGDLLGEYGSMGGGAGGSDWLCRFGGSGGAGGGGGGAGSRRWALEGRVAGRSRLRMASWNVAMAAQAVSVMMAAQGEGRPLPLNPAQYFQRQQQHHHQSGRTALLLSPRQFPLQPGGAPGIAVAEYGNANTNDPNCNYMYGNSTGTNGEGGVMWPTDDGVLRSGMGLMAGMTNEGVGAAAAASLDERLPSTVWTSGRPLFDLPYGFELAMTALEAMSEVTRPSSPEAPSPPPQSELALPLPAASGGGPGAPPSVRCMRRLRSGLKRALRGLSGCFVPRSA